MTEAERIDELIRPGLPLLKVGALRFWGEWFGRPYDNIHRVVGCEAEGNVLKLRFNEDEVLSLWNPISCIADERTFRIQDAGRVRWEWFSYGRPKTISNLYFKDFIKIENQITTSTNVAWYTPDFKPSSEYPAVKIL